MHNVDLHAEYGYSLQTQILRTKSQKLRCLAYNCRNGVFSEPGGDALIRSFKSVCILEISAMADIFGGTKRIISNCDVSMLLIKGDLYV